MVREDVVEIGRVPRPAVRLRDRVPALSRHWLAWANLFLGALVGAPWLARLTGRPLPQGFWVPLTPGCA